jgi:hypothetical protein
MNKIFQYLALCLALFAVNAFGQNYKAEIDSLRQQQRNMYASSDFKLISKKIPLIPKDATLEQLADASKPTQEEKVELAKFQQFRSRIDERGNQITMVYMKPEVYANALVQIRRGAQDKTEAALIELNTGSITFGQFNKKRRDISDEMAAKQVQLGAEASKAAAAGR